MQQANSHIFDSIASLFSPYWWCQLIGWGGIIPFWLHFQQPVDGSYLIPIAYLTLQAVWQILATHQYRNLAHHYGWINLPGKRLVPVLLIAFPLLLAQYLVMTFSIVWVRYGNVIDWDSIVGATAGGIRYLAIWLLCFHGYHFARRSVRAEAKAAKEQQLATQAQLAKLQAELNPHFLFNALNTIKALTREQPTRSRDAIDLLARILRYSLSQSQQLVVPLQEEIAMIKSHIGLEKVRFEERLSVSWELPENTQYCLLPPMSLHTLVENAIKHGIHSSHQGGQIIIQLVPSPQYWNFTVLNTGGYQPNDKLGTGLKNLRHRLRIQYQRDDLLLLENCTLPEGDQTKATLKIPRES